MVDDQLDQLGEKESVGPSVGWNVVHLFLRADRAVPPRRAPALAAIERLEKADHQVVAASILGHKADACLMAFGPDLRLLRGFQSALQQAGFIVADSYVSVTEISEYASGVPEGLKQARLYPHLPPPGLRAFCFYPMSKRRAPGAENWYSLSYDERYELMRGHGKVGRLFRGRVLQLVTGSTGLDDYEWGVTLFAQHPDDLKDCVYTMRFDPASTLYGDFGSFYSGFVDDPADVLTETGAA